MRPDFGCNVDDLMFESLTTTFRSYMADLVRNAILYHEPRIDPDSVEISPDSGNDGLGSQEPRAGAGAGDGFCQVKR